MSVACIDSLSFCTTANISTLPSKLGGEKVVYDATKKIFSSSSGLAEDILFLFTDWLSLLGERLSILKQGYTPNSLYSSCNHPLSTVLLLFLHLNPLNLLGTHVGYLGFNSSLPQLA